MAFRGNRVRASGNVCFLLYFLTAKQQLVLECCLSLLSLGTTSVLPGNKSMSPGLPMAVT